jgi:hypothetical protein
MILPIHVPNYIRSLQLWTPSGAQAEVLLDPLVTYQDMKVRKNKKGTANRRNSGMKWRQRDKLSSPGTSPARKKS